MLNYISKQSLVINTYTVKWHDMKTLRSRKIYLLKTALIYIIKLCTNAVTLILCNLCSLENSVEDVLVKHQNKQLAPFRNL